jgi:hypothetical protein
MLQLNNDFMLQYCKHFISLCENVFVIGDIDAIML